MLDQATWWLVGNPEVGTLHFDVVCELCARFPTIPNLKEQKSDLRPISHSLFDHLNIRALMRHERASSVPLLRAKEETLWLAKLAKSLHEATADGSSGSSWAAITKPRSASITTERFTAI
jgi:hypothetical protein